MGLWLLSVGLLAGCAGVRSKPADSVPPPLQFEVDAPSPIDSLLRRHLDLARLPALLGSQPLREGELDRLIAAAPEQARTLLRTEGYFDPSIEIDSPGGDPPRVRMTVRPGARAIVRDVRVELKGPVAVDAAAGDADAQAAQRALREDWPLPVGSPFRDEDWNRAKNAAAARLRAQGYVKADWETTQARVDARANTVELSGTLDSGPLHRTGPLLVSGLNHHDERTVRNLANLRPGTPATEKLLLDFQERLSKSGLFDRATVTLAAADADPAATPVEVRLGERKLNELTLGVGVGANVGARATVEHVHRRPFGRPWTARNKLEVAQVRQAWEGEVGTHTLPRLWRNLVGASFERLVSDTDSVLAARTRVGRAQDSERIDRVVFAELERSSRRSPLGRETADAIGLYYHGIWRDVDDVLLPTRGRVWSGQVGLGQARSEPGRAGPFARLHARLHLFHPFADTWHASGRIELGQVFARSGVLVPETLRFRAGGDESVRGYGYRSLAPVVDGVETSGKVVFTASAEVARPIVARLPDLWGAAFVDVGHAALRWRDLDPAVGVGIGVRYRSPVGPAKLDLAWGHDVRRLRLHLSVGVTF